MRAWWVVRVTVTGPRQSSADMPILPMIGSQPSEGVGHRGHNNIVYF
jgi:hypothetical protein